MDLISPIKIALITSLSLLGISVNALAADGIQKYTFALLIEGELSNAIIQYAENFTEQAQKQNISAQGYVLGTNEFTGKHETALPHITLVQFHTTAKNYQQAVIQAGKYLSDHSDLIKQNLTCTGAHIAPINPEALAKDEPTLAQDCCAGGKKLYWFDQDVVPAPLMPLHMYLVGLLNSIDKNIPTYNAHGDGKYRPHMTVGRYASKDWASFQAPPFPAATLNSQNYALVAGLSTPSGMLYASRIEYIFKDGKWVKFKK